jgi:DNA-binding transcriptional ArsR family regulator
VTALVKKKKSINKKEQRKFPERLYENEDKYVPSLGKSGKDRYNQVYKFLKEEKVPISEAKVSAKTLENWKTHLKPYTLLQFPINKFSESLLKFTDSNGDDWIIPLESEEKDILEIAHLSGKRHQSISHSIDKLYEMGIKYSGCYQSMIKLIKNCAQCNIQKKKELPVRKYTPIKTSYPKELLQFDGVYLPKEMGSKKLVTAIDHFSKFAWAFCIDSLSSANTRLCLEEVLDFCDQSVEVILTDNGSEFKGEFEKYFLEVGIELRHGLLTILQHRVV